MSGLRRALPVLVLCLLTACSGGGDGEPDPVDPSVSAAAVERVLAELRSAPGVVDATGSYSTRIVDPGAVDVGITVEQALPAAEREALLDRAEELVWRSDAEPLTVVNVVLSTPGSSELVGERLYQGATQLEQLEQRYGPRG